MAGDVFVAAQLLSCRRIVLPTRFHAQCDGRSTKPGGDSTDDLPITSRSLAFRLDPPRTILAAQVRDRFHLMPSGSASYQRLGCQRGCHHAVRAAAAIGCSQSAHCHHPSVTGRMSQP
jgi:hypothetical protein